MGSEIVHDGDAALTAQLHMQLELEARVGMVVPRFYRQVGINGPTLAYKFSKFPVTADAGTLTDGTAASNTGINPTAITLTAGGLVLAGDVTDFSAQGSLLDVDAAVLNFSRALANKIDVDAAAILDNFITTAGATGVNLSVANLLSAYYSLMNANELYNPVYILHPIQWSDAANDIIASSAPVWSGDAAQDMLKNLPGDPNYRGTFLGVPVFTDSNCPSSGGGGTDDRGGALLSAGRACAIGWKWSPKVETTRNVKMVATEIGVSACVGFAEVHDGAGVSIITDHE